MRIVAMFSGVADASFAEQAVIVIPIRTRQDILAD
jgi:hypothetical protein